MFKKYHYEHSDFLEPIAKPKDGELVLDKDCFYILPSKERVKIPSPYAADIVTYDTNTGEFRTHYAGFFDNGFGGEQGTNVVLEVRVVGSPFRVCDGQRICKMTFEKTLGVPTKLYGQQAGSHYTGSGPRLSKHFKEFDW